MSIKWGIIGCGDVAEHKGGPALYNVEGSALFGVTDINLDKAEDFKKRHGAKKCYAAAEEMLDDKEIDAVYVATPVRFHCEYSIQSATAGKHVLCEKPFAMNADENKQMVEACRKNNVKLAAAYYRRFFAHIQKIKSLIVEGAIGDVVLAQSNYTGYYNPAKLYPQDADQWRTDRQMAGGGVVMNCGSHRIDLLVYLLGDVAEVSAFVDTLHCNYAVEDSSVIIMRFATDAQAVMNFNQNVRASTDEFAIYGTEGKIIATPLDSGKIMLHNASGIQEYHLPPTKITHFGLVQDFVQSIVAQREPISSGEEGLKASLVMDAAYKSSELKRAVLL